ncbi:hypothetical protein ACM26V_10450 [Salipaludibacillus sp. HK11]|uniref:hypothetical protein n=1 Tax=Salipaludibacillus sp. HK11 TaxID=3394320 RepID=UPI0039FDA184
MNVDFQKVQTTLIVVLVLLSIGLLAYFFFVIQPLKQDVSEKELELSSEEQVLTSIQNSQETVETYEEHEVHTLLRTLPVHPWLDHWMLDLEKAELISDTEVHSYMFSRGVLQDGYFSELEEAEPETEGNDESLEDTNEDENVSPDLEDNLDLTSGDVAEMEETSVVVVGEDEEVNQVMATLSIDADSYDQLFQFLYEIEQLDRFTEIDALSFASPSEEAFLMNQTEETNSEILSFDVHVSTYYLDDLVEAFGEYEPGRPFVDPAMKDTPIYRNP